VRWLAAAKGRGKAHRPARALLAAGAAADRGGCERGLDTILNAVATWRHDQLPARSSSQIQ